MMNAERLVKIAEDSGVDAKALAYVLDSVLCEQNPGANLADVIEEAFGIGDTYEFIEEAIFRATLSSFRGK